MNKKYLTNALSREIVIFYPGYPSVSELNKNIRNLLIPYGYNLNLYGVYKDYSIFRAKIIEDTYLDIYNNLLYQIELFSYNKKICFTSTPFYVNYIRSYFINFNLFFENSGAFSLIDSCYKQCQPLTIKDLDFVVDKILVNVVYHVFIRMGNNLSEEYMLENDDKLEVLLDFCEILENKFHERYLKVTNNKEALKKFFKKN